MKIRVKIFLSFSTAMITFLLVGLSVFYVFSSQNIENEIYDHLETSVQTKVSHVETYLTGVEGRMIDFSSDGEIKDCTKELQGLGDGECTEDSLAKHLTTNKVLITEHLYEIYILGQDGHLIASSTKNENIGEDHSSSEVFIEGLVGEYVGDIYYDETYDDYNLRISVPIHEVSGGEELIGVIVGVFSSSDLFDVLTDREGLHHTWESYLVDESLTMISPSRFIDDVVLSQTVDTVNAHACFEEQTHGAHESGMEMGIFEDYRGEEVLGTHRYIPMTGWCLLGEIDSWDARAPLNQLFVLALIIVVGVMLSSVAIAISIGSIVSIPLEKLDNSLKRVTEGDLNVKIDTSSSDEFGDLAFSISEMLEALKEARREVEGKVEDQTKSITEQKKKLEDQREAILNILEDIELEKEKAEELALDLQKFKLAVDHASDLILITDPNGNILHANSALKKITGYELKETIGQNLLKLWGGNVSQEKLDSLLSSIKAEGEFVQNEFTAKRKDETEFEMAVSMSSILDKQGSVQFLVVLSRDVTKEKKIDQMKTEFISLASHQLRTPLSSMRWFCEMLLDGDAGELNPEQQEFVNNINQSNHRMIALVNALLNISRIESGRIIIDPEPTDLKVLVENVIQELKSKIEEHNHEVIVSISDTIGMVNIDPKLIGEVYKNLLTNAIKYTPDNGEISVFVSMKDDVIISQVSDTGYGIPESSYGNVFKKFFRAENILEYDTDGTGLGLYLTKAIVESSGGEICFESEEGKGTSFFFTIPKEGMKQKEGAVRLS